MPIFPQLSEEAMNYIVLALGEAIGHSDVIVSSFASSSLDNMVTFFINAESNKRDNAYILPRRAPSLIVGNHPWIVYLNRNPKCFSIWAFKIIRKLMMEECLNQWSLSRPLYVLCVQDSSTLMKAYQMVLNDDSSSAANADSLRKAFESLVITELGPDANTKQALLVSSRDKFSNVVQTFRRELGGLE